MTTLRAVIVDDEALGREGVEIALQALTHRRPGVEIVALCASGVEALHIVRTMRPDLLLLDIQMPEMDGFDLLDQLEPEDVPAAVVFVTAYDAHALRAFEANVLDYVMKPLVPERLHEALVRAARRVEESKALSARAQSDGPAFEPGDSPVTRLVSRGRDGTVVVPVDEIEWIQADAYNVWLHVAGRAVVLRERMHVLERSLDPTRFLRVHRSAIVRVELVRELRAATKYEWVAVLRSGTTVPVSRQRRARLERALQR
jgi:two-component system LytT family response regulator